MQISASQLNLSTTYTSSLQTSVSQNNRTWGLPGDGTSPSSLVQLSAQGVAASQVASTAANDSPSQNAATSAANGSSDVGESVSPYLSLVIQLLEKIFGENVQLINPADFQPSSGSGNTSAATGQSGQLGWGVDDNTNIDVTQTNTTAFQATGTVQTADGQNIQVNLSFALQSSQSADATIKVRAGDATMADPLVINLSGDSTQLSTQKYQFDLSSDGQDENISFPVNGGFLAINSLGNGKIVNGSQLFGPTTGNGYTQLQALDTDHNGWIDQNDPAYQELGIYSKNAQGQDQFTSLQQAGIGALYVGNANTAYTLQDGNQVQGQLVSSGVWVGDQGNAGTMQQVDLAI